MSTSPKPFCFVLMPFDEAYDDIYKLGIRAACESSDVYCERVDEQVFQETILQRVYNQISKADLIIADMSGRNPNVFYEVGYAHALGKFTLLLTKRAEDIPFDLKHFQHIVYGEKITTLKEELCKKLDWFVKNPQTVKQTGQNSFDVFLGEYNLLRNHVTYVCSKDTVPSLRLIFHNLTPYTLSPDTFRLGIVTPGKYRKTRTKDVDSIQLPDKSILHMLPYTQSILPGSYASFRVTFDEHPDIGEVDEFIVRIFSQLGTFDYPLSVGKGPEEKSTIVVAA